MILILLSTYNGARYLPEFISSLEAQSDQNWKLLVRDDTSSDDTMSLIHEFCTKYPDRVEIIIDGINLGAKASFGKLIEIASLNPEWAYLMFADQDDVWMEHKIALTRSKMEQMQKKFGNSTPLLVHTDLAVVDEYLNILAESFWNYQRVDPSPDGIPMHIMYNVVTGCSMMINRPLATLSLPIPTEAIMHDWWISLTASAFGHIGIVPQPTILYRQHSANDTGAKRYGWKYILGRFLSRPKLDKYFAQASVFYTRNASMLNKQQLSILHDISGWNEAGFWKRRWLIIRYGLWKKGIFRNIGLMVFA